MDSALLRAGLACALLSSAAMRAQGGEPIVARVFDSQGDAVAGVLRDTGSAPTVWSGDKARGAVLRTGRMTRAGRACQEVAVAQMEFTPDLLITERLRSYCEQPGGKWELVEDDIRGDAAKRARARYFIPPKLQAPGSWRVDYDPKLFPTASAAYANALRSNPSSVTYFRSGNPAEGGSAGAVSVASSPDPDCRTLVIVREDQAKRSDTALSLCQSDSGGWLAKTMPRDDQAVEQVAKRLRPLYQARQAEFYGKAERPADSEGETLARSQQEPSSPPPAKAGATRPAEADQATPSRPAPGKAETASAAPPQTPEQKRSAANQPLGQVPAIKLSDTCTASVKGAPWGSGEGAPGVPAKIEEYRAAANHALRSLKIIYGTMSAEQEAGVDRTWAPFFDHPTQVGLDWFQRANPLLDDYLVVLADIESAYPEWRDAMADTLIATSEASQSFFQVSAPVAAALGGRLDAARQRLADLNSKIEALGDAPNPLAAKCKARARHKRAVGGGDVWALLQQSRYLVVADGQPRGKDEDSGGGDIATWVTFTGADTEPSYAAKVREDTPDTSLRWNGTKFSYSSQTKNFFSPCTKRPDGSKSSGSSANFEGELSADGAKVLRLRGQSVSRSCKNEKTGDVEIKKTDLDVPEAVATLVTRQATASSQPRVELYFTSPGVSIPDRIDDWEPKPGQVVVRFADFLHESKPMNFCRVFVAALGCETGSLMGNAQGRNSAEEKAECLRKEEIKKKECDAKMAAWIAGKSYTPKATASADPRAPADAAKPAPKSAAKPAPPPPDENAAALKEAVDQHQALAKQYEQNAARWAADAGREKDPARRQELEKRAAEIAANASAERDIAASLSSGELVKTRTAWDDTQAKNMRDNIRAELDRFSEDKRRLDNIHKWLMRSDGHLSEGVGEKVSAALKSPNASQELAKIEGEVYGKVRAEKEQALAWREKEKELADWELNRPAAVAMGAANMAVTISAMAVPGAGPVAMAWGLGTGYADGGAKGVVKAGVRMYSQWIDVAMAGYEGAESGGAWGAAKGVGTAVLMNVFMGQVGPRLQKAVTHVDLGVPKIAMRKTAAPESGIQTAEQHYELAKSKAKTPEELAQVSKQYEIIEKRQAMKQEVAEAVKRADKAAAEAWKDGKLDPAKKAVYDKAVKQLNAEVEAIHEKYGKSEGRTRLHEEAIKQAQLSDGNHPDIKEGENWDIKLSGGKPKSAASDMDVTASSYKAGKAYVAAMAKGSGAKVIEYGDRWVLSNDVTVWKPTAGAKAGSSAFEAEVSFGASKGSDKFATPSGQKYTKKETGGSGDTQGAVIDNMKKAGEAGLGKQGAKDMHVIGKSTDKALEISGVEVPPALRKKLEALRYHQPPELAGVTQLGAPPAVKAKQQQAFLNETQTALAKSYEKATKSSWDHEKNLIAQQQAARQSGDMNKVAQIQQELATNRSANRTALATVADVAPELIASVLPAGTPKAQGKAPASASPLPLSQLLKRDRDGEGKAAPPLKGDDPALGDLGERCKEAAKKLDAKLKTAKAGSDEAAYLGELKRSLESGGRNPAEAVQQVRAVSGYELAVVLKQLGVEAKRR